MEQQGVPEPPELTDAPDSPEGRHWPEWLSFLHNRFIIAGLAVVVLLLLATLVLVVVDGNGGAGPREPVVQATPESSATPLAGIGLPGRIRTTAALRNGPGPGYAVLGTIPRSTLISVVGRNANETWLQVLYPPGSQLRGWVNASFVEVMGDVSELVIAGPGAEPDVPVPTSSGPVEPVATPATPGLPVPTEAPTAEPTRTPRPTRTPFPTAIPRPTSTAPPSTETPPP